MAVSWLVRGALSIGGELGTVLTAVAQAVGIAVLVYALQVTGGIGQGPTGADAKRIKRSVNAATIIELVASIAFPIVVMVAGHPIGFCRPSLSLSDRCCCGSTTWSTFPGIAPLAGR